MIQAYQALNIYSSAINCCQVSRQIRAPPAPHGRGSKVRTLEGNTMDTSQLFITWTPDALTAGAGLLVVRLVLGLTLAAHGAQNILGWFGGYGIAGTGGFFEQIGFRPGRLFAATAGLTELVGGLLVALGLLGPVGPALIVSVMIVAMASVHWRNGFFMATSGIEYTLVNAAGAVALGLVGPGVFSLAALLGLESLWAPRVAWGVLAPGVAEPGRGHRRRRPEPRGPADRARGIRGRAVGGMR